MAKERYVSRVEIAEMLGVEERTISNWVKNHPDFAKITRVSGTKRTFPIQKCVQWKMDRAVAEAMSSLEPPPADDLDEAERRKAIADAELAELKVKKFKEEVVDVSAAARESARVMERIAARMRSVPGEFAPQILQQMSMPEAVAILRRLVATSLSALQAEFMGDEDEAPPDPGSDLPEQGAA